MTVPVCLFWMPLRTNTNIVRICASKYRKFQGGSRRVADRPWLSGLQRALKDSRGVYAGTPQFLHAIHGFYGSQKGRSNTK